ncbi:hypothetical protein evm_006988 [Chilo suppressalis]|nr:hypothetical protein evm_006988 [Chilo suppressalis]
MNVSDLIRRLLVNFSSRKHVDKYHHQPINVPTAAQAFPVDEIGRLDHDPPRGSSADWWVLTTADSAGTTALTYLPKHGGARDSKANTDHCETTPGIPAAGATTAGTDGKLELAKRLASRINLAKGLGAEQKGATQQAAEAILKGAPSAHTLITAKTVAEQLAAKLNTRLNYQPRDESASEPAEEVFRKYETELEINDFPQQARWRVTSKLGENSFELTEEVFRKYETELEINDFPQQVPGRVTSKLSPSNITIMLILSG